MEKRKKRRAWAVFLAAIGIFVLAAFIQSEFSQDVYAADELSEKLYWGFRIENSSNTMVWPLYVRDDNDVNTVAYCFNVKDAWPVAPPVKDSQYQWDSKEYQDVWDKFGFRYHKISDASNAAFIKYSNSGSSTLKADVQKVVYNGYPYYAGGLNKTYGLTDMQMRVVTQCAIWYYTDGYSLSNVVNKVTTSSKYGVLFTWTDKMTSAYNVLIGKVGKLVDCPDYFALDLFITENQLHTYYYEGSKITMQNLLSTRRITSDTGTSAKPGKLTVCKKVTGNMGQKERKFLIVVTFNGTKLKSADSNIVYTYGGKERVILPSEYVGKSATVKIELSDGDSVSFEGIPRGSTYRVAEASYKADGYQDPAFTGTDDGAAGTLDSDSEKVTVTNNKNVNLDTGLRSGIIVLLGLVSVFCILIIAIFARKRKQGNGNKV